MNFSFDNPYLSTRAPLFARNVVSTSHPLAAQAGLQMLRQGGNAVDAAVAAAAAMTIAEPVSNGLGSDAFALVRAGRPRPGRLTISSANMGAVRSTRPNAGSTPSPFRGQ